MDMIEKACEAAVQYQRQFYKENAPETIIRTITESKEYYIFDFQNSTDGVLCGGSGVLVSKNDLSATYWILPGIPKGIFDFFFTATPVEIPKRFRREMK